MTYRSRRGGQRRIERKNENTGFSSLFFFSNSCLSNYLKLSFLRHKDISDALHYIELHSLHSSMIFFRSSFFARRAREFFSGVRSQRSPGISLFIYLKMTTVRSILRYATITRQLEFRVRVARCAFVALGDAAERAVSP